MFQLEVASEVNGPGKASTLAVPPASTAAPARLTGPDRYPLLFQICLGVVHKNKSVYRKTRVATNALAAAAATVAGNDALLQANGGNSDDAEAAEPAIQNNVIISTALNTNFTRRQAA